MKNQDSSCMPGAKKIGRHAKSALKKARACANPSKVAKVDTRLPARMFKRSGLKSKRSFGTGGERSKRRGFESAEEFADGSQADSGSGIPEFKSLTNQPIVADNRARGQSAISEEAEVIHMSCSESDEESASWWSCCTCSSPYKESIPSSNMKRPCACCLPYRSSRIQCLEKTNDFIQASKSTWTKYYTVEEGGQEEEQGEDQEELDPELVREKNEKAFEKLKEDPDFSRFLDRQKYQLEIDWNSKLAEGGQAEIYGATGWLPDEVKQAEKKKRGEFLSPDKRVKLKKSLEQKLVVKLFKHDFCSSTLLQTMTSSWLKETFQHRFVKNNGKCGGSFNLCWAVGAQLLRGRFAFLFPRHNCDLRQFIDRCVLKNQTTKPRPFERHHIISILLKIAQAMVWLHGLGFIHKDLKAANILCNFSEEALSPELNVEDFEPSSLELYIADFESSTGIFGTRFWRAPEVLRMLKEKSREKIEGDVMTQAVDVYSFAMTAYEVITGLIPLGNCLPSEGYGYIVDGGRPLLDDSFCPDLNNLISRCWHNEPCERPSFHDIVKDLEQMH